MSWGGRRDGFTIVELLIVVVVIAILAAITIVSYNGITGRANDSAVQSDLRTLGQKVEQYIVENGVPPANSAQIASTGFRPSQESYGSHYLDLHNLLYCMRGSDNTFAFVAGSTSGKYFAFMQGSVREVAGPLVTNASMCPNIGISSPSQAPWLYSNGVWQIS